MKVIHSDDCLFHDPPHEILSGQLVAYLESPARYHRIKEALSDPTLKPLFEFVEADNLLDVQKFILFVSSYGLHRLIMFEEYNTRFLLLPFQVHQKEYVDYLQNAYGAWVKDGGDKVPMAKLRL